MDKITRELVKMTGGRIPADDMITLRENARLQLIDGKEEVMLNARGCLVAAKYSPDPKVRAEAIKYFEQHIKEND